MPHEHQSQIWGFVTSDPVEGGAKEIVHHHFRTDGLEWSLKNTLESHLEE
jgi:hypothetical protein